MKKSFCFLGMLGGSLGVALSPGGVQGVDHGASQAFFQGLHQNIRAHPEEKQKYVALSPQDQTKYLQKKHREAFIHPGHGVSETVLVTHASK